MSRAVRGEWTKLRTVPGQLWTIPGLTAAMVAFTALIAAGARPDESGTLDPTALSQSGVYLAQAAAVLIAVAVVSSEYPRLMRTTLAANPRRGTVFTAKVVVVAAAALAAAVPAVVAALFAGREALSSYAQLPLHSGQLWRVTLGTAAYLVLVALLSAGVALVVRHAAAAVGTMLTLLYGPYLAVLIIKMPEHALHLVQKVSPMTAGLAVQTASGPGTAPLGPAAGISVLAGYAAAALAAGWVALRVRDA
ncbi:hypothetical protein OKJ48_25075 [Streptomyces kunmingensis]|uniref:ABC transporter permease n=1 Tax=Streptomyces kunmingensis TaxID=68225 RepID=A0ABU6CFK6_9ACTN|nr:hypothetical protein [Streptomyces kunmingensis]MEB3963491.1 hypothetical protein [Streptomyces kunmingensis]